LRALIGFILFSGCGGADLDVTGEWLNRGGNTLRVSDRDHEDRFVGTFDQWDIRIREHPFAGFSLLFEQGQTVMTGSETGFVTEDGPLTFCRSCALEPAGERLSFEAMTCESRTISIERFGVTIAETDFDCEFSRTSGGNSQERRGSN
jgi:hypothetical protein